MTFRPSCRPQRSTCSPGSAASPRPTSHSSLATRHSPLSSKSFICHTSRIFPCFMHVPQQRRPPNSFIFCPPTLSPLVTRHSPLSSKSFVCHTSEKSVRNSFICHTFSKKMAFSIHGRSAPRFAFHESPVSRITPHRPVVSLFHYFITSILSRSSAMKDTSTTNRSRPWR